MPDISTSGAAAPTMGTLLGTELSSTPTSSSENTLSSWYAPYMTDYLDRAKALSGMAFTPYSGPLTAGTSDLQSKAFQGIANLTVPSQYGTASTAMTDVMNAQFTPSAVQQYMNPYLQASLEPQLAEARRQADISRMQDASRLTQAGAFGGSRQAIMEAENRRNLGTNLANITGQGYSTAYDKALAQFNADLARRAGAATNLADIGGKEQSSGLANLAQQLSAGQAQRDIAQQGITADYGQYLREFQYPQEQLDKYGAALKTAPAYGTTATNLYGQVPGTAAAATTSANDLYQMLKNLGVI